MEEQPAAVPRAKQVGETPYRWCWVEPTVWTDRMLTALDEGVKGQVWYSLIDKVYSGSNLRAAMIRVEANKGAAGVDHIGVEEFCHNGLAQVKTLGEQLQAGTYQPQSIRRVYIPKPGSTEKRPLGIPTVRDRVVQKAIVHVLEPIFERDFAESSYGFRPGRGCQQALEKVGALLGEGYQYVVDADLKSYFDTIPHERLLQRVREKVADSRLLRLVESYLKVGILEGTKEWTPTEGAPQGAVLSPLLSNIYLDPLDHLMKASGIEMVRYADDFVILCRSKAEADRALELVQAWVSENELTLHLTKTRVVDASTESFEFLGYRYERGDCFVRKKSVDKLKETVRAKTKRSNGNSLKVVIENLNRSLKGWFVYFEKCNERIFSSLDGWIRRRLRSLLRRRRKRRGISRHGADEARWPNKFFAEQGLFSLKIARAKPVDPHRR